MKLAQNPLIILSAFNNGYKMTKFYPLEVTNIKKTTRDAAVVTMRPSADQKELFQFIPGQYLTFRHEFSGEEVRRSYSICSSKFDEELSVGVKKVEGGLFSTWVNDDLKIGDKLEVMPPMGSFCINDDTAKGNHYLAFAVGSGITPILSIIRSTLLAQPKAHITLVYGNRSLNSIMFREELEALKNHYLDRLNLVQIFSASGQDIELFSGRIDNEKCKALFTNWIDLASVDFALICGPEDMMKTVTKSLLEHGMQEKQIKYELFGTTTHRQNNSQHSKQVTEIGTCEVTVVLDGLAHQFEMPKDSESILQAAQANNLDVPFACQAGVCSTCKAKVIEGDIEMNANYALEDYEIEGGAILTCQSRALSDKVIVDYDQ